MSKQETFQVMFNALNDDGVQVTVRVHVIKAEAEKLSKQVNHFLLMGTNTPTLEKKAEFLETIYRQEEEGRAWRKKVWMEGIALDEKSRSIWKTLREPFPTMSKMAVIAEEVETSPTPPAPPAPTKRPQFVECPFIDETNTEMLFVSPRSKTTSCQTASFDPYTGLIQPDEGNLDGTTESASKEPLVESVEEMEEGRHSPTNEFCTPEHALEALDGKCWCSDPCTCEICRSAQKIENKCEGAKNRLCLACNLRLTLGV